MFKRFNISLVLFVISQIQLGASFNAIECVLYAIKYYHNEASKPDPTSSKLAGYVFEEAAKKNCHCENSRKKPITSQHIRRISNFINGDNSCLLDLRNFTNIILSYAEL